MSRRFANRIYLRESLEIARPIGHSEGICSVLANLAEVAARQGHITQAEAYVQEGRTLLARELGYRERLCSLLLLSGELALKQGKLEETEARLTEGVNLACTLLDRWRMSALLSIWASSNWPDTIHRPHKRPLKQR